MCPQTCLFTTATSHFTTRACVQQSVLIPFGSSSGVYIRFLQDELRAAVNDFFDSQAPAQLEEAVMDIDLLQRAPDVSNRRLDGVA